MSEPKDGEAPFSAFIETLAAGTAAAFRVYAANVALVRNLHRAEAIRSVKGHDSGTKFVEEGRPSVIESERDGRIGIDLKFGSITFKEEKGTTYAEALVDVIVGATDMEPENDTRVQMSVKIKADPETDSVLLVTERCRTQIVATLRAAAETIDATSARTLLLEGWKTPGDA